MRSRQIMNAVRPLVSRAAAPLLLAAAVLAPLSVHWLAGQTLVCFDTQILYAPQRWLVDEALRAFRLPLWNPFMGAGAPFLADAIHGVLHPVSILTAWLHTDRSADLLIGGYVACAGLGAAWLARELGVSRAGAAAAAVSFAGSGYVLSMAGNLVFLAGAGSLPFCLAGLRRVAAEPRPGSLALGVLGAAMLALSGDAQALMVGGALSLALAWEAGGWRGAARAVAAGLVGLLVAGVQLVPSAANLPRSERADGSWVAEPGVWALVPWRLPELVLPGLFQGADPFVDPVFQELAGPGAWPPGNLPHPFSQSVFIGLVPLALALVGLREGRRGRLLGALAVAMLWIALGATLGAGAVLGQVPIWRAFRYAEKLVGPLTLVVAVLAGFGLDAVAERRASGRAVFGVAAALGLAALGLLLLAAGRLPPEVASEAHGRVLRGAWHVVGALAALGGWLLLRGRLLSHARLGAPAWRVGLAALAWAGAAVASPVALRPGDVAARLRTPGPALQAEPPGPRIVVPYTHDPLSTDPGFDWLDQGGRVHAPLGYPAYNVRDRLDSLSLYNAMFPRRLRQLETAFSIRWSAAARRFAVTHVVIDPPLNPHNRPFHDLATAGGTLVWSGPRDVQVWAVPHRAWAAFPPEVRSVRDQRAALAELANGSPAVAIESWGDFRAAPGRVLSLERGLESLRVEAETEAESTLVVADAWWPGWEATIDGAAATIYAADVLVRAVKWPAGRHVLEMRYRPPELRTGLLASVAGLLALAAWMLVLRRAARGTPAR